MTKELKLIINGNPVPASRPVFSSRGRSKRAFIAPKYRAYKNGIEVDYWNKYRNRQLFDRDVPLIATIHIYRRIQKGLSKTEYNRRANHHVRPTVKPDLDNYIKAVQDGLKRAWFDDGQITEYRAKKDYDKKPRVEILVEEWTDEESDK